MSYKSALQLAGLLLIQAFIVSTGPAEGYVLKPPAHLPPPGTPQLPTPHPNIPPTYSLRCVLGYSSITRMHTWTVSNHGRNTAPAGLAIRTLIGSLHGEFRLPRALGPDDTDVFGTPVTALDPVVLTSDQCEVVVVR